MKHNLRCCFVCMQNFSSLWIIYSAQEHILIQERGCESYKFEWNMYYHPHKTGVTESRRMRWAEHEVRRQATNFWEGKSRAGAISKICK